MDANKTGMLIAAKRKEKGMTQKELAEKLHISNKAVSRWETGAGFPDVSLLEPLSQALGVTVTELLSGVAEAQPGEELVVESTRHFSREIKENRKKYRWLLFAAALVAAAAVWVALTSAGKAPAVLPRAETEITLEPSTEKEDLNAAVSGVRSYYYDVARADDVNDVTVSLEIWDENGLKEKRVLVGMSGFAEMPRTAPDKLVAMCTTGVREQKKFDLSLYYNGSTTETSVVLPEGIKGWGFQPAETLGHIKTGSSQVILQYSFTTSGAMSTPRFLGETGAIEPAHGELLLLLRADFK
jgi:transcriptional regulator with XRE-family HTH domain